MGPRRHITRPDLGVRPAPAPKMPQIATNSGGLAPEQAIPPAPQAPYNPSPSSKRTGCGHLRSTLAPYFLATRFAMAFAAISLLDNRFLAFLAGALVAADFFVGFFVGPLRLAMLRKVAS